MNPGFSIEPHLSPLRMDRYNLDVQPLQLDWSFPAFTDDAHGWTTYIGAPCTKGYHRLEAVVRGTGRYRHDELATNRKSCAAELLVPTFEPIGKFWPLARATVEAYHGPNPIARRLYFTPFTNGLALALTMHGYGFIQRSDVGPLSNLGYRLSLAYGMIGSLPPLAAVQDAIFPEPAVSNNLNLRMYAVLRRTTLLCEARAKAIRDRFTTDTIPRAHNKNEKRKQRYHRERTLDEMESILRRE